MTHIPSEIIMTIHNMIMLMAATSVTMTMLLLRLLMMSTLVVITMMTMTILVLLLLVTNVMVLLLLMLMPMLIVMMLLLLMLVSLAGPARAMRRRECGKVITHRKTERQGETHHTESPSHTESLPHREREKPYPTQNERITKRGTHHTEKALSQREINSSLREQLIIHRGTHLHCV